MTAPLPELLPPEILDKIIVIAADSGGSITTLQLCCVSQLFHQSAVRRLYHTIGIGSGSEQLEAILHITVPLRPSIASYVRVLNLESCPRALMDEALALFTSVRSLRIPILEKLGLDPSYALPNLRRFIQMAGADIPAIIAQNLTHLYLYGVTYEAFSRLILQKENFRCLTHFLLMQSYAESTSERSLELL
ncbi:hypothetical protein DL96DRAFT_201608 [Flagelloscypha sp. PMI_526]|nr:hypothetical protein DL96DRAFT_201608 [Flagelloscypha sp. PMI_526]